MVTAKKSRTHSKTAASAQPNSVASNAEQTPALTKVEKVVKTKVKAKPDAAPALPIKVPSAKKSPAKKSKGTVAAKPTPAVDQGVEQNLAHRPPRAINSPVRVFQMYGESWQRELLDTAFYPLDVSRVDPHTLVFNVWSQLQSNPATQGAKWWGAVSWKFAEQTGLTGSDWVKHMQAVGPADVYFCNPAYASEAVFHNPWVHAQTQYPQFIEVTQAFFKANNLSETQLTALISTAQNADGALLVATPEFWKAYLTWLKTLMSTANKKMPAQLRDLMHAPAPGGDGKQSYLPLILDRLLHVFLSTEGKQFKALRIALPERERELNVHQKLLREMKDVAHRTQSAWLAACWVNYRNLYLGQTQGKPWIQKHLRAITPPDIKFG